MRLLATPWGAALGSTPSKKKKKKPFRNDTLQETNCGSYVRPSPPQVYTGKILFHENLVSLYGERKRKIIVRILVRLECRQRNRNCIKKRAKWVGRIPVEKCATLFDGCFWWRSKKCWIMLVLGGGASYGKKLCIQTRRMRDGQLYRERVRWRSAIHTCTNVPPQSYMYKTFSAYLLGVALLQDDMFGLL